MPYLDLIHRLYSLNKSSGMKLGLDNPFQLNLLLDEPIRAFPAIHVAGTNGKGSVCWKIATALELAGYRVGLYTSPHISSFNERIRINRKPILKQEVEEELSLIMKIKEEKEIPATFFELTTLVAFHYFAKKCVDVAIIEVGLGGRLDATNIIHPLLSVITSISFDHCEILGFNLNEIAKEKAGIIKQGIPLIMGPRVPKEVVFPIAFEKNSCCMQVEGIFETYDEENSAVAQACLQYLKTSFNLCDTIIREGLECRPPCRMESQLWGGVEVVFDVAHNTDGLKALFQWIKKKYPERSLEIVIGLSSNKDIEGCLSIVKQWASHMHLVASQSDRAADPSLLASHLPKELRSIYDTVSNGVQAALVAAKDKGAVVVICGTFFIMSEARLALGIEEERDNLNLNESMRRSA